MWSRDSRCAIEKCGAEQNGWRLVSALKSFGQVWFGLALNDETGATVDDIGGHMFKTLE